MEGNGISVSDEVLVVRLGFQVSRVGVTSVDFDGRVSPQNPSGAASAVKPNEEVIDTIHFDSEAASIIGR